VGDNPAAHPLVELANLHLGAQTQAKSYRCESLLDLMSFGQFHSPAGITPLQQPSKPAKDPGNGAGSTPPTTGNGGGAQQMIRSPPSANSCCPPRCAVLRQLTSVVHAQQKPRTAAQTPRRPTLQIHPGSRKKCAATCGIGLETAHPELPKAPLTQLTNQG